jgi:hypothetical protein
MAARIGAVHFLGQIAQLFLELLRPDKFSVVDLPPKCQRLTVLTVLTVKCGVFLFVGCVAGRFVN